MNTKGVSRAKTCKCIHSLLQSLSKKVSQFDLFFFQNKHPSFLSVLKQLHGPIANTERTTVANFLLRAGLWDWGKAPGPSMRQSEGQAAPVL